MSNTNTHPCSLAIGNGGSAYHCEKHNCNCKYQFYCHDEKYWKPSYQIKCPDFVQKTKKNVDSKEQK